MGGLRLAPQADGEGGVELGVGRDHAPMPISLVQWTARLSLQWPGATSPRSPGPVPAPAVHAGQGSAGGGHVARAALGEDT